MRREKSRSVNGHKLVLPHHERWQVREQSSGPHLQKLLVYTELNTNGIAVDNFYLRMDPSRGDSRYNLNYSMSSIGLSLADQADMYGNPAAVAALGGRPPSAGLLQSMGGGVSGSNVGIASRSSNIMSGAPQCQSLSNNTSAHNAGQQRGVKRSGSDCYDEPHHRVGNTGGPGMANMQSIDNCGGSSNLSHGGQQQQSGVGVGTSETVDDGYNAMQGKKSPPANGKKTKGRVKIKMEYIDNKLRRYTTFSKRKTGIMKKVSAHLLTYDKYHKFAAL